MELWKISLGKPLITSNFNSENILNDKNAIIPGLDGNIYYYSHTGGSDLNEENTNEGSRFLRKVDVPLKTLIYNTPFTFPNLPDYIFIGEKKSSIFTIDVNKGAIVSKKINGEEDHMLKGANKSNNLLTVIRIDYTLICISNESGNQSWNVTVSEVMALQKGAKTEISLKKETSELDSYNNLIKQRELNNKINQLMDDNPQLNSVVSVHNFNNDQIPVKIYDVKPDNNENNFIQFFNQRQNSGGFTGNNYKDLNNHDIGYYDDSYSKEKDTLNANKDFYEMLSDYLKWNKAKIRNKNIGVKSILHFLIFKFWEMYYFEDYFYIYITIIFLLTILVLLLSTVIIKFIRRNNKLIQKVNQIRKYSDEKKTTNHGNSQYDIDPLDITYYNKEEIVNNLDNINNQNDNENTEVISHKKTFINEEYDKKIEKSKNLDLNNIDNNANALTVYKKINKENVYNPYPYSFSYTFPYPSHNKNDGQCSDLSKLYTGNGELNIKDDKYFGNHNLNADFFKNRTIDLGLQNYQKEVISTANVKFYKNIEGEYVHEENHVVITKFENSEEVESRVKNFSNQVKEMGKNFEKNNSINLPRTYSFDRDINNTNKNMNYNDPDAEDLRDIEKENNFKSKRSKSRENEISAKNPSKFNTKSNPIVNFSIIVKKNKNETQVEIDNQPNYKMEDSKKDEISFHKYNPKNYTNNENIQAFPYPNSPRQSHKRKYNYKEYSILNHEKINTTHIDEGRLDKTFEDIEKIGQGGFGLVFKAKHKIDGSYYAIKIIELKVKQSQNLMEHKVIKEVKTMMKLNHKNVVRYTTCWFQLKIESLIKMFDMSRMTSEPNTITNRSNTKTYNYSRQERTHQTNSNNQINKIKNYNKTLLNEISENDEKSSYKSKSGFNWEESLGNLEKESKKKNINEYIFFMENTENMKANDKDIDRERAFSLSIEKNENSNLGSNFELRDKIAYDDSYQPQKRYKEPTYTVYFFMQMEYCDGLPLNLFIELNKEAGLERKLIFNFFKQIVSGVNHIHKNNVIHRDLKPHNIFIFGKDSLKIGDFGLATELDCRDKNKSNLSHYNLGYVYSSTNNYQCNMVNITNDSIKLSEFVGTPLYQSPEQIEGLTYNQKVDIYAMGLILYEMCSSFRTGMERKEGIDKLKNLHKLNERILEKYPLESSLILLMTNLNPIERPNAQEIIDSTIFKKWKAEQDNN